mgnify:CR=1 FL=1
MKKLFLLIGLVVFLMPTFANAEKDFLEKIYFEEEQYLGCDREFSFYILRKKVLFFDFSKVVVDNGMFTFYLKTNYFTDDLIEGEKDVFENKKVIFKFKIHPSLPEPMVEYVSIDQDGLSTNTLLKCVNSYQLGIHCVMNPNNPRCTVGGWLK